MRDKNNPNAEPTEISVYDYFVKQYNIRLQHWHLPLVKTEKDGTFPMEVCNVLSHQVYKYKLDSDEVNIHFLDFTEYFAKTASDCRDDQVCCHKTCR